MSYCKHCTKKEPLYKCSTCGATAHVDKKKKLLVIHVPPLQPKKLKPGATVSTCFPSHFDCELGKSITEIDLKKLVKVEKK